MSYMRMLENLYQFWNVWNYYRWTMISRFNKDMKKELKRNKIFENIHKGERCYILGNGPSLKNVDLEKLEDKKTFTTNYFYKYEKNFKSSYHLMVDGAFYWKEHFEYTKKIANDENIKFITLYDGKKKLDRAPNTYYIFPCYKSDYKKIYLDMSKPMTECVNVVLSAIQCAIYMGFSEIYLLGCDFNQFASMRPGHFYSKEEKDRTVPMAQDLKYSSMAMYHHYKLEEVARSKNIKILNATEGSLIDAYERISLTELLKK